MVDLFDISLLLLRLIVASVFFASGKKHIVEPKKRGKSIGFPPHLAFLLGIAETVSAVGVVLGIYTSVAAFILMCVMLGAMYFKIVKWKKGYFSEEGYGWSYDLLLFACNFIILTTRGGNLVLTTL